MTLRGGAWVTEKLKVPAVKKSKIKHGLHFRPVLSNTTKLLLLLIPADIIALSNLCMEKIFQQRLAASG